MNIPRKRRFPYKPIKPVKQAEPTWLRASMWISKAGTYTLPVGGPISIDFDGDYSSQTDGR